MQTPPAPSGGQQAATPPATPSGSTPETTPPAPPGAVGGQQPADAKPVVPPADPDPQVTLADLASRAQKVGFKDLADLLQSVEEAARTTQEPPVTTPAAPAPSASPAAPAATPSAAPAAAPSPAPAATPQGYAPPTAQQPPTGAQPGAQGQHGQERGAGDRALPDHIRARIQRQQEQHAQKYGQLQSQYTAEQARATALEQQAQALQEEMRLKVELAKAGISDIDFGWFELSRTLNDLAKDATPEGKAKLESFDVKAWIEAQRASRPYIFGVAPTPATTGAPGAPNVAPAPPAPGPAQVAGAAGAAGGFNAMGASPQDFEARMRQGGFNYTGSRPVRRN